jgi:hypothetical protein
MNKRKDKINKKTLIDKAQSSLDEEFGSIEFNEHNSDSPEDNEIYPKKESYKPEGNRYNKVRDKGDWESELSEIAPLKEGIGRRVGRFKQLPNGLTPYEMMYGKQDNDYDILNKSLE